MAVLSVAAIGTTTSGGFQAINEGTNTTTIATFRVTIDVVQGTDTTIFFRTVDGFSDPIGLTDAQGGDISNQQDYTSVVSSVTITAGQTFVDIPIAVGGDNSAEFNEDFRVQLQSASGGNTISSTNGIAAMVILDDDSGSVTAPNSTVPFYSHNFATQQTALFTGTTADRINLSDFADTVISGAGNDIVYGNGGNDIILSGDGNDFVFGGDGDDAINLGENQDVGFGGNGNDIIYGLNGSDRILGEAGNDTILGGANNDEIEGGDGDDALNGGTAFANDGDGNDIIFGGAGTDAIYGGASSDLIIGGAGVDYMYGDAPGMANANRGSDLFVFTSAADAGDVILDFNTTVGIARDGLDLRPYYDSVGYTGTNARADGFLYVFQNGANTEVYVSPDGTFASAVKMVQLNDVVASSLTDSFFLFQ